jgi:hypothetical protein
MSEYNPYAPPTEVPAPAIAYRVPGARAPDVADALRELNQYLSDPACSADDDQRRGPRIRRAAWFVLGAAALMLGPLTFVALALPTQSDEQKIFLIAIPGILAFVLAAAGAAILIGDLQLQSRERPGASDATLRSYLRALALGRFGYALTSLAPSARHQMLSAPSLAPVNTGPPDAFRVDTEEGLKRYAQTFCRPSHGQLHLMQIKHLTPMGVEGEVAFVEARILFQSWPRWVSVVTLIAFLAVRFVGIVVGAILYFSLRKRREVRVTKTLLRGANGRWYLYDAGVVEEPVSSSAVASLG